MAHHDLQVSEHCEACARDTRQADLESTAISIIQTDDSRIEGLDDLKAAAVKVLARALETALLPKGLN
jgi:hypothetical protein